MALPLESHWVVMKIILKYLKGTIGHGLHLTPLSITSPPPLQVFCDVDWALDPDNRRSTSGERIYLDNNIIS